MSYIKLFVAMASQLEKIFTGVVRVEGVCHRFEVRRARAVLQKSCTARSLDENAVHSKKGRGGVPYGKLLDGTF